jgi:dihydroneopterin aldolase
MTSPPGGSISVTGITAYGFHGVFDNERRDGQEFVVDVVLELDLSAAAVSDDLADTVDYGGLAAAVAADVEGEPLDLIEALAARIAETCLRLERVTSVSVTVHKPQAPMPVRVADVAVTLVRARSARARSGELADVLAGDGEST